MDRLAQVTAQDMKQLYLQVPLCDKSVASPQSPQSGSSKAHIGPGCVYRVCVLGSLATLFPTAFELSLKAGENATKTWENRSSAVWA